MPEGPARSVRAPATEFQCRWLSPDLTCVLPALRSVGQNCAIANISEMLASQNICGCRAASARARSRAMAKALSARRVSRRTLPAGHGPTLMSASTCDWEVLPRRRNVPKWPSSTESMQLQITGLPGNLNFFQRPCRPCILKSCLNVRLEPCSYHRAPCVSWLFNSAVGTSVAVAGDRRREGSTSERLGDIP